MISSDAIIAFYDRHAGECAAAYDALSAEAVWSSMGDLFPVGPDRLALDVGAGSGRDAAWLASRGFEVVAAEPAPGMRREGMSRHPALRWIDDRLPDLSATNRLGLAFDLVLLGAVWMHVPPPERPRAFRKLVTLLRPGALMMITLRQGTSEEGRPMHPTPLGEIEPLARDHGLTVVRAVTSPDVGGRPDVSWTSVCLRLPDDGSVGLPMIRGVVLNDDKSSTYKLGLLRAVAKIADVSSSLAIMPRDAGDRVAVPLGLVSLNWIRAYLPLVAAGLPQAPGNAGPNGLGFAKAGFRALVALGVAAQDLRIGATFTGDRAGAVHAALAEARRTIVAMPVRYTRMPNAASQLFEAIADRQEQPTATITLTPDLLWSWGVLSMPGPLWRTMQRFGVWIEPVLIAEWVRLTRGYALRMSLDLAPGAVEARMAWSDPSRDTALARMVATRMAAAGRPLVCVWSGAEIRADGLDIDHALPWSAWPCNDLWNLLPASRRLNQHEKRDGCPLRPSWRRPEAPSSSGGRIPGTRIQHWPTVSPPRRRLRCRSMERPI